MILDTLYKGNIVEMWKGPRPLDKLTNDQFEFILNEANTSY